MLAMAAVKKYLTAPIYAIKYKICRNNPSEAD